MSYYDRDRTTAAGTMGWPTPHIGATGEYLVSAWPYSLSYDNGTGGPLTNAVAFNYVTKFITITALITDATVSLQGQSAFVIPAGTTQKFEVKATTVAVTVDGGSGFRLVAGMTNIPKEQYPAALPTYAAVTVS